MTKKVDGGCWGMLKWSLLVLWLMSAAVSVAGAAAAGSTAAGRVLDGEGKPVADAAVFVVAGGSDEDETSAGEHEIPPMAEARTDAGGRFEIPLPGAAPYILVVKAAGFALQVLEDQTAEQVEDIDVMLRAGLVLRGRVFEEEGGAPVEGVRVKLEAPTPRSLSELEIADLFVAEATSDRKGRYGFSNLAMGDHELVLSKTGYAKLVIEDVEGGNPQLENEEVLSYLEAGVDLSGRIVDPEGMGIAEAKVRVFPTRIGFGGLDLHRWESAKTTSFEDGTFQLDGVPSADGYNLYVRHPGFATHELRGVSVGPSGVREGLLIELDPGQRVVAALVFEDESPFDGKVSVIIDLEEDGRGLLDRLTIRRSVPDSEAGDSLRDGVLTLEHIPAGRYRISITPQGYESIEVDDAVVVADEVLDLGTFRPTKGRVVAGRVVDQDEQPVADADLLLSSSAAGSFSRSEMSSDEQGRFEFVGLTEKIYTLSIASPKHQKLVVEDVEPDAEPLLVVLEPAATITGRVLAGDPPQPIRSYRIEAIGEIDKSLPYAAMLGSRETTKRKIRDEQGVFEISGLGRGKHNFRIFAPGFVPLVTAKYELTAGETLDLGDLFLDKGARLSGIVRDAEGSPIAGAKVSIPSKRGMEALLASAIGGQEDLFALTTPSGSFEIQGLSVGEHPLQIRHPRYAPYQGSVTIGEDLLFVEKDAVLAEGGRIRGTFRDKEGLPITGGMVIVTQGMMSDMRNMSTTDSRGLFEVEHLPAGTYQVMGIVPPKGDETNQSEIMASMQMGTAVVVEGKTTVVNLPDNAGGIAVHGRVMYGENPVAGSMFWIRLIGGRVTSRNVLMAQADADGKFQIRLVDPGEYQVSVIPDQSDDAGQGESSGIGTVTGYALTVDVPEGGDLAMEIRVPEGAVIGRTYDEATGEGISNVMVRAAAIDDDGREVLGGLGGSAQSDEDGHFEIRGLGEGRYNVYFGKAELASAKIEAIEIDEDEEYEVEQALGPAVPFKVHVSDPRGRPVQGASITGVDTAIPFSMDGTDELGELIVRHFGEGHHDLVVTANGYAPLILEKQPIDDGENRFLDLTLSRGGSLRMRILDAEQSGISGAAIEIRAKSGFDLTRIFLVQEMMRGGSFESDTHGDITIANIEAGRYEVEVFWETRRKKTTVEIKENEETVEKVVFR